MNHFLKEEKLKAKNEDYWRDHLNRCKKSGKTIKAYCEYEGLGLGSFYTWKRRLDNKCESSSDFVALKTSGGIVIELTNGLKLSFESLPEAKWMSSFLGALNAA